MPMQTPGPDGHLAVEGCHNLRDTGGWPVEGGRLRTGRLLRSDDATRLTDAGRAAVIALDLACVVDLRQQGQFDRGAHFADLSRTYHVPLVDRVIDLTAPPPMTTPDDLADLYVDMLGRSVEPMARAIDLVAAHVADGPVLVHCVYGKDRTGLVVAAIQAALGSDRASIVAEYARSDAPTNRRFEVMAADPIPGDGPVRKAPRYLFNAPAAAMEALLDRLVEQHDSLDAWIASFPLHPDTRDRLRAGLVDPSPAGP